MTSLAIYQWDLPVLIEWMSPKYLRRYEGIQWHKETSHKPTYVPSRLGWIYYYFLLIFHFKRNKTAGQKILKLGRKKNKFKCIELTLLTYSLPHIINIYWVIHTYQTLCYTQEITKIFFKSLHLGTNSLIGKVEAQ